MNNLYRTLHSVSKCIFISDYTRNIGNNTFITHLRKINAHYGGYDRLRKIIELIHNINFLVQELFFLAVMWSYTWQ